MSDDDLLRELGPFPRVHPRSDIVRSAEGKLSDLMSELQREHRLTLAEQVHILSSMLGATAGLALRIERERHPQ